MKKIVSLLALPFVITALNSNAKTVEDNFFNGNYVTIGAGKSFTQKKISHQVLVPSQANPQAKGYHGKKLKNGNIFKVAVGHAFPMFRLEVEYLHNGKRKLLDQDRYFSYVSNIKSDAFLLNGYYDFKKLRLVTPYIGAGIGYSKNKLSAEKLNALNTSDNLFNYNKKTTNSLAWNVMVGSIIEVNKNLFFDFSYKYLNLGKVKGANNVYFANGITAGTSSTPNVKGRLNSHVIMIGIGIKG